MNVNMTALYQAFDKLPFGNKLNAATLKIQAKSPEILMATGIVTVIGGTVLACKATVHAGDVIDEFNKMRGDVAEAEQLALEHSDSVEYSDDERRKDLVTIYVKTGVGLLKVYGPSIAVLGLGIASILASHGILKQRNVALVAAYDTVKSGFDAYRKRAIDKFGDEVDKQLRYGLEEKNVTEKVVDENGEEHKTKKIERRFDPSLVSQYARWFSPETSHEFWNNNPSINFTSLKAKESYCNQLLQTRGFVFLNEVYTQLGFPMTPEGQQVGWLSDGDGDNFIDFGLLEARNMAAVDGMDKDGINAYLLDFNVDGPIMYKI